nr:hypothetical protein [uncultured Devosia sp.]
MTRRRLGMVVAAWGLVCLVVTGAGAQQVAVNRADGSVIDYRLDVPASETELPLVIVAQGSGCDGARQGASMQAAVSAFALLPVLTVEKYGVASDDDGAECTAEFLANSTMSQRVADYRAVLARLDTVSWWDGRVILFGGSEGGLVMARLAREVKADAAVLLSTAPGVTFDRIVLANVPDEGQQTMAALFERALAEPDSLEMFSGYPFRFWADAMQMRPLDDMLATDTKFLVIHGGQDGVPVDYSRLAADRYAAEQRCELTYWEFPALDHSMRDPTGVSQMSATIGAAADWALVAASAPGC